MKNSIKLIVFTIMAFAVTLTLKAQEDDSYVMWESIMLTPDNSKLKVLSDNMRAHNAKYHKEIPYASAVYNIVSGPNSGKIVWMMGPMQFKHNDSRPSEGGHDEDWRDNVMPYIKKMHTVEYWTQDNDLSNTSMLNGDASAYPLLFVRYVEINSAQSFSVKPFYKQVSETVKSMEGDNPWGLYYNEFRQGNLGRHIASVSFYKNWTEFDSDKSFKKAFEKVHGEGKWQSFIDMSNATFSNSWDEMWAYNAHMSGK